jgi:hypothetical protein
MSAVFVYNQAEFAAVFLILPGFPLHPKCPPARSAPGLKAVLSKVTNPLF